MQEWVSGLVRDRYKTVGRLAKAIGMTDSGFGRAVEKGTLQVENCLRLAKETGTPAPEVFKLAGKSDVNDLITQLYGVSSRVTLSQDALEVAETFDAIPDEGVRGFVRETLEAWKGIAMTRARSAAHAPSTKPEATGNRSKRGSRRN